MKKQATDYTFISVGSSVGSLHHERTVEVIRKEPTSHRNQGPCERTWKSKRVVNSGDRGHDN